MKKNILFFVIIIFIITAAIFFMKFDVQLLKKNNEVNVSSEKIKEDASTKEYEGLIIKKINDSQGDSVVIGNTEINKKENAFWLTYSVTANEDVYFFDFEKMKLRCPNEQKEVIIRDKTLFIVYDNQFVTTCYPNSSEEIPMPRDITLLKKGETRIFTTNLLLAPNDKIVDLKNVDNISLAIGYVPPDVLERIKNVQEVGFVLDEKNNDKFLLISPISNNDIKYKLIDVPMDQLK